MDVRLNAEQRQLRDAAAKLADDLGPDSVAELDDAGRIARLERAVNQTGWRALRSDGASGVEVAIVAEEFGRGLVDVAFLGPVLADDLRRHVDLGAGPATVAVADTAIDARGAAQAVRVREREVATAPLGAVRTGADLTRPVADLAGTAQSLGELGAQDALRWQALALVATCADLVGTARGAHALACDYAKIREQYGKPIGSYQAVAHLLAEGLALIEGSVSVLRHAAWAVDAASAAEAVRAARIAKIYSARAARTVCETAIQVHGGIGNTWECAAHLYLRRALTSTGLWPVTIREIADGLS
ncbi:acyl-CoA dehydrogenase family protein [Mycolicibacter hiberniae]|uniref:Acyl-CoA dehydrogenase n=1 Tax=Mycolicibacter hiberniae TaxID=29314 RepID=A0A7I7X5K7_9MYCO|nr:acyl-CoA dehydrogenase family protein [Mycolicibacter hiberniae]MCV7086346.1 acyl-CoA dehydrogenase [Mycolicibacter hiberniae]ORV69565.1 acyl-CoA dehydrogenase [Mycolicibacter hiberniae]BBZ24495.1 acyl-CoA dehydrogenase [Mycolicibacter hiberniae]